MIFGESHSAWLGIHRPAGQWQTLDGAPLAYQNWKAGSEEGDGLVGALRRGDGGRWQTVPESGNRSTVCEADEAALEARLGDRGRLSSYLLVPGATDFAGAVQACAAKGSSYHPVSVQSWEEADFVLGEGDTTFARESVALLNDQILFLHFFPAVSNGSSVWLSLSPSSALTGTTHWLDGSPLLYQNWATGQSPKVASDGAKASILSSNGQWKWVAKTEAHAVVCKKYRGGSESHLGADVMYRISVAEEGLLSRVYRINNFKKIPNVEDQ